MGNSNYTCEVKVPMHDDLVDFKSIDNFQNIRKSFKANAKWSSLERKRSDLGIN